MSTAYELTGRTGQKARTRAAMVDAARALLSEGITPTVEQAAERAAVSRTTAYRYFANQRDLLIAAYPMLQRSSLLGAEAPDDPADRLAVMIERFTDRLLTYETELRAMLRLSLDSPTSTARELPLRRGRAVGWIEDALAPLGDRMPARARRRLALAIRATTGVEALVWLCDVAGLSRQDAVALMRWSAQALLKAALDEARAATPAKPRTKRRSQRARS